MNNLETFDKACQAHDWTYMYSDDHRAYTAGNNSASTIWRLHRELVREGFKDKADEIVSKYRPQAMSPDMPIENKVP